MDKQINPDWIASVASEVRLCRDESMMPPQELVRAAIEIEHWFKERGIKRWELAGICSRNHADALRSLLSEEQL